MRITLALATGAALVVLGSGGAAYAVVAQGSVNPTTTGNVLPIDDNHSPITATTDDRRPSPEPGDDRGGATTGTATGGTGTTVTTRNDHGRNPEPGDDRDGRAATTRAGTAAGVAGTGPARVVGSAPTRADDRGRAPEPGDDRGRSQEPGDDRGRGRGSDDAAGHS